EPPQQADPLAFALYEEPPPPFPPCMTHGGRYTSQLAVAGKQDERAAIRRGGDVHDGRHGRAVMADLVRRRVRQVGRHSEKALLREIERRREDLFVPHRGWGDVEAHPPPQEPDITRRRN